MDDCPPSTVHFFILTNFKTPNSTYPSIFLVLIQIASSFSLTTLRKRNKTTGYFIHTVVSNYDIDLVTKCFVFDIIISSRPFKISN